MNGLILVNKSKDITSFKAVAMIRRAIGVKRVGHTGTLDPMATGLLPVLTGRATKLSDYLLTADKSYRAQMQFGIATDSYDCTGTVMQEGGRIPTRAEIEAALPHFVGRQQQKPPMFSAIKQNGVKLYKLARNGQMADIPPRAIEIYHLKILDYTSGRLTFDVDCSKGTYIRSLCVDIAAALGTIGCMTALHRTRTLGFSVCDAMDLEQVVNRLKAGDFSFVLSPKQVLAYDTYYPPAFFGTLLSNGLAVEKRKLPGCPEGPVWVEMADKLLGIGRMQADGTFKIMTHL